MKHQTEIPETFLLTIAVHGNMGDGELPDLMKIWAQKECNRLNIDDKFRKLQAEHLEELSKRIANVIGNDNLKNLEKTIDKVATAIRREIT